MRLVPQAPMLAGVLLVVACSSSPSDESSGSVQQQLQTQETGTKTPAQKPVDDSSGAPRSSGKPEKVIKGPGWRRASLDEVEDLEKTYRTAGSREILLDRIRETSDSGLVAEFNKVADGLPSGEQIVARGRLKQVLDEVKAPATNKQGQQ